MSVQIRLACVYDFYRTGSNIGYRQPDHRRLLRLNLPIPDDDYSGVIFHMPCCADMAWILFGATK
jgi:hypothetical protein